MAFECYNFYSGCDYASIVVLVKNVMKICTKFKEERPCRSVISIKFLRNFIEITMRHGCSPVNLLHIFKTPKNTYGGLLLVIVKFYYFLTSFWHFYPIQKVLCKRCCPLFSHIIFNPFVPNAPFLYPSMWMFKSFALRNFWTNPHFLAHFKTIPPSLQSFQCFMTEGTEVLPSNTKFLPQH